MKPKENFKQKASWIRVFSKGKVMFGLMIEDIMEGISQIRVLIWMS